MNDLIAWSILFPLLMGAFILLAKAGGLQLQQRISLLAVLTLTGLNLTLLAQSLSGDIQVYLLGNWPAPFGITLVLDKLSALMLVITAILALISLIYAISTNLDQKGAHFHILFQFILFGLNGAFLTGDVFNLFVFFEVLLLASYALLLHGGGKERTKAGLHYVIINLAGATIFLFAVGALYGILGTLNIADMANKIPQLPKEDLGVVAAAGLLLLVVFALKAALFPLYLWLPIAYSHTSAAVAALFAIMTKVGIYAIIRVHGTLFGENAGELAHYHLPWVLGLGLITLLLAALGVMASTKLREQITYLILASVATLLIAVGINTPLALSATLYYLIHSTFIAAAMLLLADIILKGRGPIQDKLESGYRIPNAVFIGSLFMFGAIAITGMPPLSGFFGKALLLDAALEHPWYGYILTTVFISSFIMIVSITRTGSLIFYKTLPSPEPSVITHNPKPANTLSKTAIILLLIISPILVLFAGAITSFTESTAQQYLNSKTYIEAVLTPPPIPEPYDKGKE